MGNPPVGAAATAASSSTALDEFIELVYSSQDAKNVTQVRPAINYIDANYDKTVTLADIAGVSHLSVSRLAHIFKEQRGITIIDYLTGVRICGHLYQSIKYVSICANLWFKSVSKNAIAQFELLIIGC